MLRGTRIGLRPIREADLGEVYHGYSNLEARGEHYPHDLESEQVFRKAFEEHGYWQERQGTLIVVEPDGTIVGEVSFFPVHGSGPWWTSYELGYVLYDPERAGRGYMTEAVQLMVNHLFETKQIHRIQLTIAVENLASQAVAKRCGFTFEGIARGAFFMHGAPQDVQVWAILSTDERP